MGIKSSSLELSLRVKKVAELLLDGTTRVAICEYALKNWGVTCSQSDRYIAKAKELVAEQPNTSIEADYQIAVARYERLFNDAVSKGNTSLATRVLKEKCMLEGLSGFGASRVSQGSVIEDIGAAYFVMDCYGRALKSVVSQRQLLEIVQLANSNGATVDITNIESSNGYIDSSSLPSANNTPSSSMDLAMSDLRILGRHRTREELDATGWANLENNPELIAMLDEKTSASHLV